MVKKSDTEFEWVLAHDHLTEFKPQKPSDGLLDLDNLMTYRQYLDKIQPKPTAEQIPNETERAKANKELE